jgi:hypothetical protein
MSDNIKTTTEAIPFNLGIPNGSKAPKQNALDLTLNPAGQAGVGLTVTPGAKGGGFRANPMNPASAAAVAQSINNLLPQAPQELRPMPAPAAAPEEATEEEGEYKPLPGQAETLERATAFGKAHSGIAGIESYGPAEIKYKYKDGSEVLYSADYDSRTGEIIGPWEPSYALNGEGDSLGFASGGFDGTTNNPYQWHPTVQGKLGPMPSIIPSDARLKRLATTLKNIKY